MSKIVAALLCLVVAGGAGSLAPASARAQTAGFAGAVTFDARGLGLAVFGGGSLASLEAAGQSVSASGIWLQDPSGVYRLLVVGGPAFLKGEVTAAFPNGFSGPTAVTVVRTTAPASAPATPSPAAAAPAGNATYANCTEARAAGVTPLYRGQPGYGAHLDRDNDGVACE